MQASPKITRSWLVNVSLFWLLYYLTLRTRPNVCLTKGNHLKFYSHTWDTLLSLSSHNINPDFLPLWPFFTTALYQRHLPLCSKSAPPHPRPFFTSQFWIKAVFFFSFFKPEVSPYSDSSRGMMSVVLTPQVLLRGREQPVRTCLSRGRDAIAPPSPLSCSRMLSSPRYELLSVGGRDDGKMFFPTCAMLSSCCDTETAKHPYFHFLTFTFPSILISATVIRPDILACAVELLCYFLNLLKCNTVKPPAKEASWDEFFPQRVEAFLGARSG